MKLDFHKGKRKGSPERVIAKLRSMGHIPAAPAERMDYMDYYVITNQIVYAGLPVVAVEHEYMADYVGCCVNPGLALVVTFNGAPQSLERIAFKLGCSVKYPYQPEQERLVLPSLKHIPAKQLARIRCQEADAQDAMLPQ